MAYLPVRSGSCQMPRWPGRTIEPNLKAAPDVSWVGRQGKGYGQRQEGETWNGMSVVDKRQDGETRDEEPGAIDRGDLGSRKSQTTAIEQVVDTKQPKPALWTWIVEPLDPLLTPPRRTPRRVPQHTLRPSHDALHRRHVPPHRAVGTPRQCRPRHCRSQPTLAPHTTRLGLCHTHAIFHSRLGRRSSHCRA